MPLTFLPLEIEGVKTDDELIAFALSVFRKDFKEATPVFTNLPVLINTTIVPQGWEYTFHHIITRDPTAGNTRVIDATRAKRIPWIKPLISNYQDASVTYFQYLEGSGYIRHYIWNELDNYLVILESKAGKIFLVTAFNIDIAWKKYDLRKKQQKAIK